VTVEHFPNMVGVGQIAKDAWDQIYTFGKVPTSEMANVCREIEAIQQQASGLAPASCSCEAKN